MEYVKKTDIIYCPKCGKTNTKQLGYVGLSCIFDRAYNVPMIKSLVRRCLDCGLQFVVPYKVKHWFPSSEDLD